MVSGQDCDSLLVRRSFFLSVRGLCYLLISTSFLLYSLFLSGFDRNFLVLFALFSWPSLSTPAAYIAFVSPFQNSLLIHGFRDAGLLSLKEKGEVILDYDHLERVFNKYK